MILIVDDNPFDAELIAGMLRTKGYESVIAADGHDAIALLPEIHTRIQLILLDLDMPVIDGISALGHFKTHYAHIPVIILTGTEDKENEVVTAQWQVAGFYRKPMSHETMDQILSNLENKAEAS